MNHKELQASRKLLMLEVNEAAEHVGQVRARTWYYWEEGRNPIPPEVAQKMMELTAARCHIIQKLLKPKEDSHPLPYSVTFEDYKAHPKTDEGQGVIDWRIEQSVAAHFYAEGMADLI